jgi:gas vesicle protein
MKILPLLLISLVLCNVSIKNQNSAISVFKCLLTDEKFIGSLKNIISSLREHLEDKDVLALIKSLLENVPVALKEINVCLNSEPELQSWWDEVVEEVEDVTDDVTDFAKDLGHDFENIGKDLGNQMESIGTEISQGIDNIGNELENISQDVIDEIKRDTEAVKGLYNQVANEMTDMTTSAVDKVQGVLSDAAADLEVIQQVWDSLPQETKDKILHGVISNVLDYGEEYAINACCIATAETLVGCPVCYVAITLAVDEIEKLSEKYVHA